MVLCVLNFKIVVKLEKREIRDIEDIKLLVNSFYEKVREDDLIGPIFDDVIGDSWDSHLPKMYSFWQTVLLGQQTYFGAPFVPHIPLPIDVEHFQVWMKLWHQTVDDLFVGEVAEDAKWRAGKMKDVFLSKLQYIRSAENNS